MKKCNLFKIFLFTSLLLGLMMSVSAISVDDNYVPGLDVTDDINQAFDDAKSENKDVLLIFDQDGCVYCDILKENTLTDSEVQKELNSNFVVVVVDINKNFDLADDFDVYGTPTIVCLNSDGDEIQKIEGYLEPDEFLNMLKEI